MGGRGCLGGGEGWVGGGGGGGYTQHYNTRIQVRVPVGYFQVIVVMIVRPLTVATLLWLLFLQCHHGTTMDLLHEDRTEQCHPFTVTSVRVRRWQGAGDGGGGGGGGDGGGGGGGRGRLMAVVVVVVVMVVVAAVAGGG